MSLGFGPPYPAADREYIRDLKEKHCYVTLDYDMEMSKNAVPSQQKKVQLPDGREISLEQEALTCSEALFHTSLIGESRIGGHSGPVDTLTECRGKERRGEGGGGHSASGAMLPALKFPWSWLPLTQLPPTLLSLC